MEHYSHPAIAKARAGAAAPPGAAAPADRPQSLPVVDQPRLTRDDVAAGRCSGLQVNALSVREHQALLRSRGQRPLSLSEIAQIHGADAAEAEQRRLERARAAAQQYQRRRPDLAVRHVEADGRTWRVTIEAVDDGGDNG